MVTAQNIVDVLVHEFTKNATTETSFHIRRWDEDIKAGRMNRLFSGHIKNKVLQKLKMKTPQPEVDRRVKEIADLFDIRWLLTRKPKQLSGGQHQRIAIARALIKNPQILLCDEPFSNLAPDMRFEFRSLIKKINEVYGTTIVFVTHDLNEAFSIADRIMVLTDGEVEEIGTPDLLRFKPKSELIKGYLEE